MSNIMIDDDYIEVEMEIGELFDRFEKLEGIKFSNNDEYIMNPNHHIQVQNEHNEWIDISGLVTKEDSVTKLGFDNIESQQYADNHLIAFDKLHTKYIKELSIGDAIIDVHDNTHIITSIEKQNKPTKLYDLQVKSDTHLYQTANGLIHHNSVGLINLSWNYVQMGKDVIYISLELKEAKIMKRYISHSVKIPARDIPNKEYEIFNHIKESDRKGYGRFTTHFFQPNTLSSMKLELFVRNYIQKYGTVPVIVLDYAGLMIPNGKNWQGMFERDKYVSEELRGVATIFDTVVWTADQYNRCIETSEKVTTPSGDIEIGDVTVGDKVLGTNNEWRIVQSVTEPEKQEVYKITLESGKTIMVSERHIFPKYVDGKLVDDNIQTSLKVGDLLYSK